MTHRCFNIHFYDYYYYIFCFINDLFVNLASFSIEVYLSLIAIETLCVWAINPLLLKINYYS